MWSHTDIPAASNITYTCPTVGRSGGFASVGSSPPKNIAYRPTRPSPPSFTGIYQMTMEHQWYQPKTARGATDMSIHHMRAISDAPPPLSSVECRVDWVASAANARLVRVGRYNGIYVAWRHPPVPISDHTSINCYWRAFSSWGEEEGVIYLIWKPWFAYILTVKNARAVREKINFISM